MRWHSEPNVNINHIRNILNYHNQTIKLSKLNNKMQIDMNGVELM